MATSSPGAGSAPPTCPHCGKPIGLTGMPIPVAAPGGRLKVHTRPEAYLGRRVRTVQDAVADAITAFSGSMRFVYLHIGWFALWIVLNAGLLGASLVFDKFPYGLLTMIVSLEAIFLSTFVLISQNRQAARDNVRAELDFETNLRSEIWSLQIGRVLGLDPHDVEQHVQRAITAVRQKLAAPPESDPTGSPDPLQY
jgi:uncharacterized membrane protein